MKKTSILFGLLLLSGAARAHTGHGAHGFVSGFMHPLLGWDHLLAMVAVGVWAAQQTRRFAWTIPASFSAALAAGMVAGLSGVSLIPVETGIAASLLVLGLLIASAKRVPLALGSAAVAAFAVFHGLAHGAEMQPSSSIAAYGLGMIGSTLLLHLAGYYGWQALSARTAWWRAAGLGLGSTGMLLLITG